MDWATITRAEWISAVSVLISLVAASYTWRNYRLSARKEQREIDATKPIVEHVVTLTEEKRAPWLEVYLTIRNRHPHRLRVSGVRLLKPAGAQLGDTSTRPSSKTSALGRPYNETYVAELPDRVYRPNHGLIGTVNSEVPSLRLNFHLLPAAGIADYVLSVDLEEPLAEIRRSAIIVKIRLPIEMMRTPAILS